MLRDQCQRLVEEGLGGGVVEAFGRPGGGDAQPGGGEVVVAPEPGVLGDHGRVGARLSRQDPPGLPVQQGAAARGGPADQRLAHQLVPEPVSPGVLDDEAVLLRQLDVGQHVQGSPVEHGGEQVDVEVAEAGSRADQVPGRPELVAPARDRGDQRRRELTGRHQGQLGQEQRVTTGAAVEVVGALTADQLGHLGEVERSQPDLVGGRKRGSLDRTGADHHEHRQRPAQDVDEPVGERLSSQVRIVDHQDRAAGAGNPAEHRGHRGEQGGRAQCGVHPALLAGRGRGQAEQRGEGAGLRTEQAVCVRRLAEVAGDRSQDGVERRDPVERPTGSREHEVAGCATRADPGVEERRLADPRLAHHLRDPRAALGDGTAGEGVEVPGLAGAPDQDGRLRRSCRDRQPAAEDRGVERPGLGSGLGAELVGERLAERGVRRQRQGRPAAGRLRPHDRPHGLLVQGIGEGVGRGEVERVPPVPGVEERRGGHLTRTLHEPYDGRVLGQGPWRLGPRLGDRTADQRQPDAGGRDRARDLARRLAPFGLTDDRLELREIEPVRLEAIATVGAVDPVPAQHPPQPAGEHRELVAGPGGRLVPPERVGEHVGRDRPAAGERQQVEQVARLAVQARQIGSVDGEFPEHPHGQCTHGAERTRLQPGCKPGGRAFRHARRPASGDTRGDPR